MKTINTITHQELEALENKYRNPASLEESCILRGVQVEIKERDAYRRRESEVDFKEAIYEKEREISGLNADLRRVDEKLEDSQTEDADLREQLSIANDKLEKVKSTLKAALNEAE